MKVVLASKSPRRKELLHLLFPDFDIRVSDADEDIEFTEPGHYVEILAVRKAHAVERGKDELIIGADTIVFAEGRILGKPADEAEGEAMMRLLSGRKHSVYTGVCLIYNEREICFHEKTDVYFTEISEEEMSWYMKNAYLLDKAGAYAIQQHAARFIEKIDGDYNNVVGLPVYRIYQKMKEMDLGNKS